jgi:hypothetical protein
MMEPAGRQPERRGDARIETDVCTMRFLITILSVFICLLLSGCGKSVAEKSASEGIVQANIAGQNFYIPRAFLQAPYTSIDSTSTLIQTWYPGDKVVPDDPNKLWKEKKWDRNIRILVDWYKNPNLLDNNAQFITGKLYHATKVVGVEYGLIHQTQAPGVMPDDDDVWINKSGNKVESVIACGDEHLYPNPQCKEYIIVGNFGIQPNYSKKLLPDWRQIHDHSVDLFKSFATAEGAKDYYKKNNAN